MNLHVLVKDGVARGWDSRDPSYEKALVESEWHFRCKASANGKRRAIKHLKDLVDRGLSVRSTTETKLVINFLETISGETSHEQSNEI